MRSESFLSSGLEPIHAETVHSITIPFTPSNGLIGYVPDEIVVNFKSDAAKSFSPALIAKAQTGVTVIDALGKKNQISCRVKNVLTTTY